MSRDKGKRGERQAIALLQPVVDEVYSAHGLEPPLLQRNTLQSDRGGFDVAGLAWMALEVKYHSVVQANVWWEQTRAQAGTRHTPVLLWRKTGAREWTARLFGYVGNRAHGCRCVVTVDQATFLAWFRLRLNEELLGEER